MKISVEHVRAFLSIASLGHRGCEVGGDLCFSIGKKMFCVTRLEQTLIGDTVKVKDEDFEKMISKPGFRPADYVARYGYPSMTSTKEQEHQLRQSYELIKAKVPKELLK